MATVTLLEPPRTSFAGILTVTGALQPTSAIEPTSAATSAIQHTSAPTPAPSSEPASAPAAAPAAAAAAAAASPPPTDGSPSPDDDVDVDSDSDNESVRSWSTARTSHRHTDRRVEFDPACTEVEETVRTSTVWLDEHGHRRRSRERRRHRRRYERHYCHDQIGWPLSRDMFFLVTLCFILGCLTIITFRPFAIEYFEIDRGRGYEHDS
ncbi:hypothetical protein HDZ31DRAFT_81499 [Schizophyllum fasciatum]